MYFSSGSWSKVALELKLMIGGISKLFIEKKFSKPDQRGEVMLYHPVNSTEQKKV